MPLPTSIWQNDCVHIWPRLAAALRAELTARNLIEEASGENISEKLIQTGTLAEISTKHFTHRFKTSAARLHYVILDPRTKFEQTSLQLKRSLYDGVCVLLDAPCGSGGGLYGLLAALAAMRDENAIPRLPLDVKVLAADVCPEAMSIHEQMLNRIQAELSESGIRLSCVYEQWDVMNRLSTTKLMKTFRSIDPAAEDMVILVSAFSEFASKGDEQRERVMEAIADIIKATYEASPALAWVEPITNSATTFLGKLWNTVRSVTGYEQKKLPEGVGEKFTFQHPFTDHAPTGSVQVLPIEKIVV